jgi:hypothetical protein
MSGHLSGRYCNKCEKNWSSKFFSRHYSRCSKPLEVFSKTVCSQHSTVPRQKFARLVTFTSKLDTFTNLFQDILRQRFLSSFQIWLNFIESSILSIQILKNLRCCDIIKLQNVSISILSLKEARIDSVLTHHAQTTSSWLNQMIILKFNVAHLCYLWFW